MIYHKLDNYISITRIIFIVVNKNYDFELKSMPKGVLVCDPGLALSTPKSDFTFVISLMVKNIDND